MIRKVQKTAQGFPLWPRLCLGLILLFVITVRVRLLSVPLERDEGEFAYMGRLMLQGVPPYQLAYSIKLPGVDAAYALLMAVLGQTAAGVHLGLLMINLAAIVLVFLCVRELFDDYAAAIASAVYALMSISPAVVGFAAHATHFVVLAALGGFWCLLRGLKSALLRPIFCSGLLFGTAFMMKQPGVFFGVWAGLALICARGPTGTNLWLKRLALFSLAAVTPFGLTCLLLWKTNVFENFWRWTFVYASGHWIPFSANFLPDYFKTRVGYDLLFWLIALIGLVAVIAARAVPLWKKAAVLSLLLFSFFAVGLGFYFHRHYFVLVLPALGLLIGGGCSAARQALKCQVPAGWDAFLPTGVFLACLASVLVMQRDYLFEMSPAQISEQSYQGNPFIEATHIADYIRTHSSDGDRVAIFGSEPEIYFYSDRRSASAYLCMYDLVSSQTYAKQMREEMMREVETAKPEYVVFVRNRMSWLSTSRDAEKAVLDWVRSYLAGAYHRVGAIDHLADQITYRWDDEAPGYAPQSDTYILLFRRNQSK